MSIERHEVNGEVITIPAVAIDNMNHDVVADLLEKGELITVLAITDNNDVNSFDWYVHQNTGMCVSALHINCITYCRNLPYNAIVVISTCAEFYALH